MERRYTIMRTAKLENYKNNQSIEKKKINEVPEIKRHVIILTDKDKVRLIKNIERIVRGSQEYKQYIGFLKKEIDMTHCSFFTNVKKTETTKKLSIEIHHEPFTLFDIVQIVTEKWIAEDKDANPLMIADEVMKLHYQGRVGLIPLSLTVHELIHEGKLFIPLQNVYGNYISFLEEYEPYIDNDIQNILEVKLQMSRDANSQDLSILEKKFVYLEVDGMSFPQPVKQK